MPWEERETFAASRDADHHFALDLVSGQLELRPGDPRGRRRAGRSTAPSRRRARTLRFSALPPRRRAPRQRRGGHADDAQELARRHRDRRQPARGASAASTPSRWTSARQRAAMEIRSRYRAVTAEDYEFLRGEASPRVARARCVPPARGRRRLAAPAAARRPADRRLEADELIPDERLLEHGRRVPRRAAHDRHDGPAAARQAARRERRRQPPGRRPTADPRRVEEDVAARALHLPQPAHRRLARRAGHRLAVRPPAQPGRAVRRRARDRRRRVRQGPARVRDRRRTPASRSPSRRARTSSSSPTSCSRPATHIVKATPAGAVR